MKRSILLLIILFGLVACGDETPQKLIITLTTADGEESTYKVDIAKYDITAPKIIHSYPKNDLEGDYRVDPEDLHNKGVTVVFSEPVTGILYLIDGVDDLKWDSMADGHTMTLTGPPFKGIAVTAHDEDEGGGHTVTYLSDKAIGYDTLYTIQGRVADDAGNKTAVHITFITSESPF